MEAEGCPGCRACSLQGSHGPQGTGCWRCADRYVTFAHGLEFKRMVASLHFARETVEYVENLSSAPSRQLFCHTTDCEQSQVERLIRNLSSLEGVTCIHKTPVGKALCVMPASRPFHPETPGDTYSPNSPTFKLVHVSQGSVLP